MRMKLEDGVVGAYGGWRREIGGIGWKEDGFRWIWEIQIKGLISYFDVDLKG
jgi:hypothetical protein